jgi:hypothetical protein
LAKEKRLALGAWNAESLMLAGPERKKILPSKLSRFGFGSSKNAA